jgi:hypothetical protein
MVFPIAYVSAAQRRQQSEWAENPNGEDVEQPHDRREFLITLPLSLYFRLTIVRQYRTHFG